MTRVRHLSGTHRTPDGTLVVDEDLLQVADLCRHPALTGMTCDDELTRRVFGAVEALVEELQTKQTVVARQSETPTLNKARKAAGREPVPSLADLHEGDREYREPDAHLLRWAPLTLEEREQLRRDVGIPSPVVPRPPEPWPDDWDHDYPANPLQAACAVVDVAVRGAWIGLGRAWRVVSFPFRSES